MLKLKTINVLIHLIGAVHLIVVTTYNFQTQVPADLVPLSNKMGGKAKYLTVWANVSKLHNYVSYFIKFNKCSKVQEK